MKVLIGAVQAPFIRGGAEALDRSFGAHLHLEPGPVPAERRARILRQLAPLAAVVVGEELEAALVDTLEQHHTRARRTGGVGGGERHRSRIGWRILREAREQGLELGDGIEQVGNGVSVRMAVLYLLLGGSEPAIGTTLRVLTPASA